jgi:hypothetical protein
MKRLVGAGRESYERHPISQAEARLYLRLKTLAQAIEYYFRFAVREQTSARAHPEPLCEPPLNVELSIAIAHSERQMLCIFI